MAGKKHNATPARSAASASASKAQRAANAAREPAASPSRSAGGSQPPSHGIIAEAAYYKAASRGFSPGYELQDWLEAEREVHQGARA